MPLSVFAKWSHLYQDEDDTFGEQILFHPNGRDKSSLLGVIEHCGGAGQVKTVQRNDLNLDTKLAEALLLKVWEHFRQHTFYNDATEMLWSVADLTPSLHHWFYYPNATQIARTLLATAPLVQWHVDMLTTVID